MSDRLSQLEARVEELTEAHRLLETRLAALELRPTAAPARRPAAGPRGAATAAREPALAEVRTDAAALTRNLALAGRLLLVLAGAFLLRAVTDAGTLPTWLGVGLGFVYAGVWVAMAYRAGPAQPWSAGFHALAAILVAFPLLFEATTRFRLLSPVLSAVTLTGFTGVALAVAAHRKLPVLAWMVEVGGLLAAVALVVATGRMAPPLLYLVVVGVATLWLGYVAGWVYLRWPVAIVLDLLMIFLALRALAPSTAEGPTVALLVQLVLIAAYLGSFAARTLVLDRDVVDFEIVQTAALLLVGLGGAALVTVRSGMGQGVLGALGLAFGLGTYAVAFAFLERRKQGKTNFYFYASVAVVFVLVGSGLLLSGSALAAGWAALALAAATLARALRRMTLAVHAALYGLAALLQGAVLSHAATTLLASPAVPWPPAGAMAVAVVAATAAAVWLTGAASPGVPTVQQRIPRCALLAAVAIGAAGLAVGWVVPAVAGPPGHGADAGFAATARTAVLVAGVLALTWLGRAERWREAGWLAYPLLVLTGLKLLVEDIARSRPATLFVAFGLYGAALILVPRLRRRAPSPPRAGLSSPGEVAPRQAPAEPAGTASGTAAGPTAAS